MTTTTTLDQDIAALNFLKAQIADRAEKKRQATPGIDANGNMIDRKRGLLAFIRYFWDVLEPETKLVEGWALDAVCQHLEAVTLGKLTRVLINVPPGFMKAADCETPVLTTDGWKRHGDLEVGDYVYGPDGLPKKVLGRTPNVSEECYEVVFDDGANAVVGAGHLWAVERDFPNQNLEKRGGWKRKPCVVSTPELRPGNVEGSRRCADRIALSKPLQCEDAVLPIDPYLLGVWLGDGSSDKGVIYSGDEDLHHFVTLGHLVAGTDTTHRVSVECLTTRLRALNLIKNKHIPDCYMFASEQQRWALLQGLMDTDGQASPEGWCRFTGNERLTSQFVSLASSLGLKPRLGKPFLSPIIERKKRGPYYRVRFTPQPGMQIFRLERKQNRLPKKELRAVNHRYLVSVKQVEPRLVNCIQVEDQLYLITDRFITTHNSLVTGVWWAAWEWGPMNMPHLRYVSFSYSSGVTEDKNVKFRTLVQSKKYRDMWGDRFELEKEGEIRITNNKTGSKFASSVGGIGTGERGDRVVLDDPHSVQQSESDVVRNATLRWFQETMSNRLNDINASAIVIIMQRVHQNDVSGLILESAMDDYCHLMIPMRFEEGREPNNYLGWKDPRSEDGQLAWPERFPEAAVDKLEFTMGTWATAAQHQQRPSPRGGGIIQFNHWQPYDPENAAARFGMTWPMYPPMSFTVLSVDTAQTEKKQNDPSAGVLLGVCPDMVNGRNQVILMHAWAERLEFYDLCQKVEDTCKKFRVHKVIIEDKASGLPLASELRRRSRVFSDRIAHGKQEHRERANFTVQTVRPEGDKVARAYAVQNLFEAAVVWAPCDERGLYKLWADRVMTELAELPKGRHDDLADAMVYALKFLRDIGVALMPDDDQFDEEDRNRYKRPEVALYPGFA